MLDRDGPPGLAGDRSPPSLPKGTQSIERAIRILKAFDGAHPSWDATSLSDALGLSKTTVVRMMAALEHEGLLHRKGRSTYMLGPELIAMGGLAAREWSPRDLARGVLSRLSGATGEGATYEVPWPEDEAASAEWMLVIEEVDAEHVVGARAFVGRRLPIHATASGRVILAYGPPRSRDELARLCSKQFTNHTPASGDDLAREVEKTRERGYALVRNEYESGLIAMAAPVLRADGSAMAAVTVHWPAFRFDDDVVTPTAELLREASDELALQLGLTAG